MTIFRQIASLILVVIIALCCAAGCKKKAEQAVAAPDTGDKKSELYKVEIGKAAFTGEANAPVTIINFSDFQCPFSKRSVEVIDKLMRDNPGKIAYYYKHFPLGFHKEARPAAKASIAAQKQMKFWDFYRKAFENQQTISEENIKAWATEIGLDMAKFESDLADNDTEEQLNSDMKQGNLFGVRGTPTLFINGVRIVGANISQIEPLVKEQLAIGEALKAKGSKDIYTELVKDGLANYVPPKRQAPAIPKDIYRIEIPEYAPVWGDPNAPVTIILFDDYECPFCSRLHSTFADLKKQFEGKIRIAFVNLPLKFHQKAVPAAKAAVAAGRQGKFWEMYDILFTEQQAWKKEANADAWFEGAAQKIGLDVAKFKKDRDDSKTMEVINRDMALADKIGVRGTPGSFVNGRFVGGAYPLESFQTLIKEELDRAQPFIAKGLKGNDLYNELVKEGKPQLAGRVESEDPNKVYTVNLNGKEPLKGIKTAPITIVEFSEHQCPFCKRGSGVIKEVLDAYKGKVKVVFKHMPLGFHKQAIPAAKLSIAVKKLYGDDKFFMVSDYLFDHQSDWTNDEHLASFEKFAKELKLDWNKVKKEMDSPETEALLKEDIDEAGKHGVRGVPAFFINGKKLSGAQPIDRFKQIIDTELKEKK